MIDEENYGIDFDTAHKRAIALIPEEFFWSCLDDLAPFGAEAGDAALAGYRKWRQKHPAQPTIDYLKQTIKNIGKIAVETYNEELLCKEKIKQQLPDHPLNHRQYIHNLDVSVMAAGFAQLVDEGLIEADNKPLIKVAIERQILWSQAQENWGEANVYISYLQVLKRALQKA